MARYNPELMQIDDGQPTRRVFGQPNPPVSEEELAKILEEEDKKYNPTTGIPYSEPEGNVPAGFTPGPFPQELEKFFASSSSDTGGLG
jgi:hypothetical protein